MISLGLTIWGSLYVIAVFSVRKNHASLVVMGMGFPAATLIPFAWAMSKLQP